MKQFFTENNDPQTSIQIALPTNIRFKFYETRSELKMENQFTFIQADMPLCEDMKQGLTDVVKLTKELKSKFIITYAQFLTTYLSQFLVPRCISAFVVDQVTRRYTLAFSNTPGAIKPLYFINKKGEKVSLVWSYTSMVTPGYFGLQINAQSCCDSFRVCVTSNTGLLTEAMNARIAELIEINIEKEK
jgi:hypothetical protein